MPRHHFYLSTGAIGFGPSNVAKFALTLTSFLFFGLPNVALRAQVDWNNTTGTSAPWYNVGSNWVGGTAPTANQLARFNQIGTYEVWWDATTASETPEVGFLQVSQGTVTFLNNGGGNQAALTINGSSPSGAFSDFSISGANTSLTVRGLALTSLGGGQILDGATLTLDGSQVSTAGFDVSGNLNVQSGGLLFASESSIGRQAGSTGMATVTGSGSQWNQSGNLFVGEAGNGTLTVSAGGVVSDTYLGYIGNQAGSTGVVTITGSGSQWNQSNKLYVGDAGNGTLTVADGGRVNSLWGYVGRQSNSTGEVIVTGSGSQWNLLSSLYVGDAGNGTLRIEAGGGVSNYAGSIGLQAGSTGVVTVTGSGSHWNHSGDFYVGSYGNGTLTVSAGGVVRDTDSGYIGHQAGSTGVVTITGSGSQWNHSGDFYIGNYGSGTLTVSDGGIVSDTYWGYIGNQAGSTGVVTITGSGSQWNQSLGLYVGKYGDGTLNIEAGSVASITAGSGYIGQQIGSTGAVSVTGSGSQWNQSNNLYVGDAGNGTLTVADGGRVSSLWGYVGRQSNSTGEVIVTGSGSQWNLLSGLYVGDAGNGTLKIEAGGGVNNYAGSIGLQAGSTGVVTVTGSGSHWNHSGANLFVGEAGNGTLTVSAGGVVSDTGSGYIGYQAGSTGVVTITGSGSQWNQSNILSVGRAGNGTLTIEAGGVVSNLNGYIGQQAASTGVVTVTGSGSHWNQSASLYVGGSPVGAGGIGTLTISDGGLVSVGGTTKLWNQGSLTLDAGGILDTQTLDLTVGSLAILNGGVLHADFVLGDLFNESGTLGPGNSPGVTSVSGNYGQGSAAILDIELGGLNAGQFDQLLISGDASWDGLLVVSLYGNFSLGANQQFLIASVSGTQVGMFTGLGEGDLVGNLGGRDLFITYNGFNGTSGVGLFTAVPEPTSTLPFFLTGLVIVAKRRNRR